MSVTEGARRGRGPEAPSESIDAVVEGAATPAVGLLGEEAVLRRKHPAGYFVSTIDERGPTVALPLTAPPPS